MMLYAYTPSKVTTTTLCKNNVSACNQRTAISEKCQAKSCPLTTPSRVRPLLPNRLNLIAAHTIQIIGEVHHRADMGGDHMNTLTDGRARITRANIDMGVFFAEFNIRAWGYSKIMP